MTQQNIDLQMLSRIDSDQKSTASRVDRIDENLRGLAREVSEIKGTIKVAETPWWIRFIVAPVCVTSILATAGAVIHLEIVVSGIEKNVAGVQVSLTRQSLATYAALPPGEFKAVLPDLSSSIAEARVHKVTAPPKVVDDLTQRLTATDADTAGFWPAAAELVSYRSQILEEWKNTNLPLCTDKPAEGKISVKNGSKDFTITSPLTYRNCKVVLDSAAATMELSRELSLTQVLFDHCAIFYSGGPIILVPVKVATEQPPQLNGSLVFKDCLFVFSVRSAPALDGQRLIKSLLAAPPNDIRLGINLEPSTQS